MDTNIPVFASEMISEDYEIFHLDDFVDSSQTWFHYHDYYEIHISLTGSAVFLLDGKQFEIKPGTVLLIHDLDLHRLVSQSTDRFERVFIYLTSQFLQKRSTHLTNLEKCFYPTSDLKSKVLQLDPELLRHYMTKILTHKTAVYYGEDIQVEQELIKFLITLNQMMMCDDYNVQAQQLVEDTLIVEVIDYITAHLSEVLTIDSISSHFYLSKNYLSRRFKQYTNISLHKYVLKKRLIYAKQLLKKYQSPSEIYERCGFNSYTHFLKCFKKEFNMTPKAFIKKVYDNDLIVTRLHQKE